MATYLHAIDGRLRVRLPELRQNRRAAARLRSELQGRVGVTSVDVNLLTGSVLVEHDENRLSADEILSILGVEDVPEPNAPSPSLLASLSPGERPDVTTVVAEKAIELAAERLLLAVLT